MCFVIGFCNWIKFPCLTCKSVCCKNSRLLKLSCVVTSPSSRPALASPLPLAIGTHSPACTASLAPLLKVTCFLGSISCSWSLYLRGPLHFRVHTLAVHSQLFPSSTSLMPRAWLLSLPFLCLPLYSPSTSGTDLLSFFFLVHVLVQCLQ